MLLVGLDWHIKGQQNFHLNQSLRLRQAALHNARCQVKFVSLYHVYTKSQPKPSKVICKTE